MYMNRRIEWLRKNYLVISLLLLILFRLVYLFFQNIPVLNQDESALLMNARFIAETGHDEWHNFLPLTFKSFGDYKLPGYIYATAILGRTFGFGIFSTRLLSFLAGIANVILVYILGKKLFSRSVGWWTAVLLVLSPWSWHFSSIGFEANVGLAFYLLALAFALEKPITGKTGFMVVFSLFLGGLTYNSPFLLSPLIFFTIALWQGISGKEAQSLLSAVLATAMALFLMTLPATLQKGGISIFTDPTLRALYPEYRASFTGVSQTLIGNQYAYFARKIASNIYSSFDWNFLVVAGGANPWHTIPQSGHLHFLIPILAALSIGLFIYALFIKRIWKKTIILLLLLTGALIPAMIIVDSPHATR